jgi:hypothetical protein
LALKDPTHRKARALKMLEAKILDGASTKEIAQQFGVSEKTVYEAMSLARKAEIVVKFEDRLYEELLPLAHSAVMGALADGNAKIGLAVLQGTQVLRPNQARSQNAQAEDDELARYINQKRAQAALHERTIDGTLVAPQLKPQQALIQAGPTSPDAVPPVPSPEPSQVEPPRAKKGRKTGFATAETILHGD